MNSRELKLKLKNFLKINEDFEVFIPSQLEFGDLSTNLAFILAQKQHSSPFPIAQDLMSELLANKNFSQFFKKIETKNGYLNFFINEKFLFEKTKKSLVKNKKLSKTVIVDFSSPNIGKPLSIAHLRSTIIGDSLSRIYDYLGFKVIRDNHLGDWGLQIGKLIAAFKIYSKKKLNQITLQDLYKLYVKFNDQEKNDPSLTQLAKLETKKLQNNDKENLKIWKVFYQKTLTHYKKIYSILNVNFDYFYGESHYQKIAQKLIADLEKRKKAIKSEGALIISLEEYNLPPLIIKKSDESLLYASNDLATIVFREKKFKPSKVLYVIASEQTLYLEQLFKAAFKLKLTKSELLHIKFGMLLGENKKKLSTRGGKIIDLEEVINLAIKKALTFVLKKNPKMSKKQALKIAQVIGIGALKYNDLSQNKLNDIILNWDKLLSLNSNSSIYLQYTYSRFFNILKKAQFKKPANALKNLEEEDLMILRKLSQFKEVIQNSQEENSPNLIANYLYSLSVLANNYYEKTNILKSEVKLKNQRLTLVYYLTLIIETGLDLLGINVLPKI
jgi:arginyl-tRNA synthetase